MNRKFKAQIKSAFNAPKSAKKKEFLQYLSFPKATYTDFIFSQIGYIRKRVWLLSGAIVIGAFFGLKYVYADNVFCMLWLISSVLPFVTLTAVTEILRSTSYHMAELEMSCRYSLADIVLVRLGILGSTNFFAFIALLLLFIGKTNYGLLRLGAYLFVPFMLTCTLSLVLLNHFKIRETTYICGGISCFVSILNSVLVNSWQSMFTDRYLFLWEIVFFVLLSLMVFQTIKLIKKMEELGWNLPLTA